MKEHFTCFGYGSLVNDDTRHPNSRAIPARLTGYRREWRIAGKTPRGRSCGLTVSPHDGMDILGTVIVDHVSRLGELDEREWRYDRHAVQTEDLIDESDGLPTATFLYRSKTEHYRWGDADHPIIQSYVDVVLKGYLTRWGEAGVRHFVETTRGWHVPIINDRLKPRYLRAVAIVPDEIAFFDEVLAGHGAQWLDGFEAN